MHLSDVNVKTQFVITPCYSFTIVVVGESLAVRECEGSRNEWPVRAVEIDAAACVILAVIKSKHILCFDEIKIRSQYLVTSPIFYYSHQPSLQESGMFSLIVLTCVSGDDPRSLVTYLESLDRDALAQCYEYFC